MDPAIVFTGIKMPYDHSYELDYENNKDEYIAATRQTKAARARRDTR